ncbi:phytoene/squalene synthase family protein [Luteimonas chenhongjianii]|uniref:Phytoene/squalene synthase family protein n=1 Tax=Luteimonas chenhongjianii TaxID=2006110 RepID=A0A290XER5_9GAMM|nr:phytoene/squalene synthase family protein [Luteimonas chenhongjianii]ATD67617.1 phytoene/squalene synthase family protein [Luteimonas chenhongjianii]
MSAALRPADEDFVAKWQARWPEWRIGMAFVEPAMRERAAAWFSLLEEFGDAAWAGAEATPGLAKLAWWQEELQGWGKGARRHPLGTHLQRVDAPWQTLALALRLLPATREHPNQLAGNLAQTQDLALAIAACEARLFGDGSRDSGDGRITAVPLLAQQALVRIDRALAAELLEQWPSRDAGTRPRRIANAISGARLAILARTDEARPVPALRVLWSSWRAALAR